MPDNNSYDVVIVGAGLAGSIIAYKLGMAGKKVLIVESGVAVPVSREKYMERFYTELAKTPESPYPDNPNAPRATVLQLGNVEVIYQAIADKVLLDEENKRVTGIHYITYTKEAVRSRSGEGIATGKRYVLAAHAIETPKLLLNSSKQGVANSSGEVGKNLMDHPLYLAWGRTNEPTWPYRGPLATAGIESLRDGEFRSERAAFRVEFGNEGWNFAAFDPGTTTLDYIDGTNGSGTNKCGPGGTAEALFGTALVERLNAELTRQFRFGFLIHSGNSQWLGTTDLGIASSAASLRSCRCESW